MSSENPDQPASRPELISVESSPFAASKELRPHWLHPTSLLFEILSHLNRYLIPAAIAFFSAASGNTVGIYIALFIFVPSLISSIFHYFTLRYQIHRGELIVREGLFFRRVRTIPVQRIQNIDLVQNVLHRLFRVAEVRVETASGTKPEATLRVLSMRNVELLRQGVFDARESSSTSTAIPASVRAASSNDQINTPLLKIPTVWLLRAGLASNRGMLIVGILIGAYYQFDLEDRINQEFVEQFIPKTASTLLFVMMTIGAVMAALVVLRLLGIVWFILRFHGYRLLLSGNDLRISCGLLTRVSATVPRRRIQFISIHRTLFMRWMGLAAIRIETAGGAGSQNENATTTVSRRWFIPVLPEDRVPELISTVRPGLQWDESSLEWRPLAARAKHRLIRISVILSVLIGVFGLVLSQPWGWLAGVLAMPPMIWWAIKKSRAMRYARTADGVVYRSGVINRKTSVTFFEKIQTLRVAQTPFDRRWKMATLSVDTAAAGPAEHRISIPYLDISFARQEYDSILVRAAQHQPVYA